MTRTIHCDQEDIIKILAEYFKTDRDNVKLEFYKTYQGYGMMEHEVYEVYADIREEG